MQQETFRPQETQRQIGLFCVLLITFSGIFYGLLVLSAGTAERWLSSPLPGLFMWCPGAAALVTCLLTRRSVRGLGWSWGGLRYYAMAYALPLAFGLPVYALLWWSGLGEFDPARLHALAAKTILPPGPVGLAGAVLVVLVLAPFGVVSALGEEIGWRGFLVPRLGRLVDLRRTSLIIGLLWSLWHYPLIFLVVPNLLPELPIWFGTLCFTMMVVAASGIYTWLRVRSDSVFPAALLHATSNTFLFGMDRLTVHHTPFFSHEYGLGLAIAIPLVAWPFWRRLSDLDQVDK